MNIRKKHVVAIIFAFLFLSAVLSPLSRAAAHPGGEASPARMKNADFAVPDEGCALDIDLDEHLMTVYMDGAVYKTYPVSGGKSETPSPIGIWTVVSIAGWGEGFGGSWIGLDVPWGVYGIHGTLEPWLVGQYNVSHGCIRMRDADVAEVKQLVSLGSVVRIRQENLAFRELSSGMVGSDVLTAQQLLMKLGFYAGMADGVFGDRTESAVRSFQEAFGLAVDGVVGRRTFDMLSRAGS